MSFLTAALVGGGLSAVGGITAAGIGAGAAGNATTAQTLASMEADAIQTAEFGQIQANEAPFIAAGQAALPQMQAMANNPAQFSFTPQQFAASEDPAYNFDLQQGLQAAQNSAAAQGLLKSGGTLASLNNYAQGQASNEYSNAYNRAYQNFTNSQSTQFNRLAALTGVGQTATGSVNTAGQNTANNVANTTTSLASAQGASSIAQGNIWGSTISGIGNSFGQAAMGYGQSQNFNSLMNRMYPNGGVGGGVPPGGMSTLSNMMPTTSNSGLVSAEAFS
jgi:hypothetical protein